MLNKIIKHTRQGTFLRASYFRLVHRNRIKLYAKDFNNILHFGTNAPRFAERIWINPNKCRMALYGLKRGNSGKIMSGEWPPVSEDNIFPVTTINKIQFCIEHWVNGVAWEHTGAYEHMQKLISTHESDEGCFTMDDVVKRYQTLDQIFEQVKKEGRMRTRKDLDSSSFREDGGIYIHIGPDGEPFFGGGGQHRFAIASILKLPLIPAQIGCVHHNALPLLAQLRQASI